VYGSNRFGDNRGMVGGKNAATGATLNEREYQFTRTGIAKEQDPDSGVAAQELRQHLLRLTPEVRMFDQQHVRLDGGGLRVEILQVSREYGKAGRRFLHDPRAQASATVFFFTRDEKSGLHLDLAGNEIAVAILIGRSVSNAYEREAEQRQKSCSASA
jgi:hypothetical protein